MKLRTANGGRRNSGQGLSCLVRCVLLGSRGSDSSSTTLVEPSPIANELTVEALADGSYRCHPDGTVSFPGILYNHGGLGTTSVATSKASVAAFGMSCGGGADLRSLLSRRMS
jgi:hypothetical protein